jgi:cytoskeleton protein RodZ
MSDAAHRQASIDGLGSLSPGIRLKAAREAQGQSIDGLSRTMHVSPQLLLAMETDAFNYFDAPVFARGYLRQYAGCLRLPVDEIISAYDELTSVPELPSLIPPMSIRQVVRRWPAVRMPAWWVIALVMLLVMLAVAGAWWLSHTGYRLLAVPDAYTGGVEAVAPAIGGPSADAARPHDAGAETMQAGANVRHLGPPSHTARPK